MIGIPKLYLVIKFKIYFDANTNLSYINFYGLVYNN
jgi:hypothetical protein